MYRARIVFNAPLDREHVFYSVAKKTLDEIQQMLDDLGTIKVHLVSCQIQESDDTMRHWKTISPLGLIDY